MTERDVGQSRPGEPRRQGADGVHVQPEKQVGSGGQRDGEQGHRERGPEPCAHQDDAGDRDRDGQGRPGRCADPGRDRPPCQDQRLLGMHVHAERRGHLLERDDDGNAEGESLDHRDRHVADEPAQAGVRQPDQDETGHQADHQHAVGAVRRDDRHQDDGHRPRGAADLEVAATEHGCDRAGDDRRDQAGARAHPGADAEAEGERERDQADHQTREQVLARAPSRGRPLGTAGQEIGVQRVLGDRVQLRLEVGLCGCQRGEDATSGEKQVAYLGHADRVDDLAVAPLELTSAVRRSTASCWERLLGSIAICWSSSCTAWSRSLSSSRIRIRAGWPRVRRRSALAW